MVMLMIILLVVYWEMQNFMKLGVEQVKYGGLSLDDLWTLNTHSSSDLIKPWKNNEVSNIH
jgi:hypothetical protein